jgi:hypothetical protein
VVRVTVGEPPLVLFLDGPQATMNKKSGVIYIIFCKDIYFFFLT